MPLPPVPNKEYFKNIAKVLGNNMTINTLESMGKDTSGMEYMSHPELESLLDAISTERDETSD